MILDDTDMNLRTLEQAVRMHDGQWHDQPANYQEGHSGQEARGPGPGNLRSTICYLPVQQAEIDWAILGLILGSTQSAPQAVD